MNLRDLWLWVETAVIFILIFIIIAETWKSSNPPED